MGNFCDDVRALIGEDLRAIGATHIRDARSEQGFDETQVCFFSASDKVIAIPFSPRDGATCFIRDAESADLSQYETWDALWHLLGMDKDLDFDVPESVVEYLNMFPKGHHESIKFIGTSLVNYFGSIR
ncbi:MAG TPA: hypothetical protein VGW12_00440 [Pyrinomonadaceae bacterium]|nr:hypothetical protein [Pyrinomonadaceae bacterium]